MYIKYLHYMCLTLFIAVYTIYTQGLFQSHLGTAHYALLITSSSRRHGSLDTCTDVHMAAAKFKPHIFSVLGSVLSNIGNMRYECGPMCASGNFQWCGEPYFAGAAISIDRFPPQIPRRDNISHYRSTQGFEES
jgi:hypothetical protein